MWMYLFFLDQTQPQMWNCVLGCNFLVSCLVVASVAPMINDLVNYIAAEKVEEFHFNNDFLLTKYLYSLIRCFSDILIRMSESYKTVRNPTDGVIKFWQKCKNFWQFCLKRFGNMVRMSEFLTFWSYSQNVRKGPDQANSLEESVLVLESQL